MNHDGHHGDDHDKRHDKPDNGRQKKPHDRRQQPGRPGDAWSTPAFGVGKPPGQRGGKRPPNRRRPRWGMTAYRLGIGVGDPMIPTKQQVDQAREELSAFFIREAQSTARMLHFDFAPALIAPLSYRALQTAYEHSVETGDDFPIPAELCQAGFLTTPLAAGSFHFRTDVARCQQQLLGDVEDTLIMAQFHVASVELSGLSPLAIRLLEAHLVGRLFLKKIFTLTPLDRIAFAVDVVSLGIADAMLRELERHDDAAVRKAGEEKDG